MQKEKTFTTKTKKIKCYLIANTVIWSTPYINYIKGHTEYLGGIHFGFLCFYLHIELFKK